MVMRRFACCDWGFLKVGFGKMEWGKMESV